MTHAEMMAIAKTVCESRMCQYSQWQDAYVVIATGVELGLQPMRALQTIHNMKGKPSPSAALLVGLVKGADVCQSWRTVENTDKQCTIETLRKGETERELLTYTIADAKRAGLGGGNWSKYPREMLYARCSAILARRVYPDVVAGLYVAEELDNGTAEDTAPAKEAPRVNDTEAMRDRMVDAESLPDYVREVAGVCADDEVRALVQQATVIVKGAPADKVREMASGVLGKYEGDSPAASEMYLALFGQLLAQCTPDPEGAMEVWTETDEDTKWKWAHSIATSPDNVMQVASRLLPEDA